MFERGGGGRGRSEDAGVGLLELGFAGAAVGAGGGVVGGVGGGGGGWE